MTKLVAERGTHYFHVYVCEGIPGAMGNGESPVQEESAECKKMGKKGHERTNGMEPRTHPGAAPRFEPLKPAQILTYDEADLLDDARAALGLQAVVVAAAAAAAATGSWGLRWPRREVCGYSHSRRRLEHWLFSPGPINLAFQESRGIRERSRDLTVWG